MDEYLNAGIDLAQQNYVGAAGSLLGGSGGKGGSLPFIPARFVPGGGGGGSLVAYNGPTDHAGDQLINATAINAPPITTGLGGRVYDQDRVGRASTWASIWRLKMESIDEYPGGAGSRSYPVATERALLQDIEARKAALKESGQPDISEKAVFGFSWDLSAVLDLEEVDSRAAAFYPGWEDSLRPPNLNHDEIDGPPFRGKQAEDLVAELKAGLNTTLMPPAPMQAPAVVSSLDRVSTDLTPPSRASSAVAPLAPGRDGDKLIPFAIAAGVLGFIAFMVGNNA